MPFEVQISDVIALVALLLSGFAVWKTVKFNERQKSLIESQERLNNQLLEKGESELLEDLKADLGASFIKLGSSNHRLKIWNKGKAAARNVRIDFPEGNDVVIESEVAEKFPLESLDQHQAVELIASVTMGTKPKHVICLMWADDFSESNEKIVHLTL